MVAARLKTNIPQHSVCLQPYYPKKNLGYASRWVIDRKRLSETVLSSVWSPIVWQSGVRRRENFLYADWLVLDFDETVPLKTAVENIFCDMTHLIGTTKSHTKETPSFRVCIPFETRITDLDLYEGNLSFYADKFDADPKPTHGATLFYPCREIVSKNVGGYYADVLDKRKTETETADANWDGKLRPLTKFAVRTLAKHVIDEGERDQTAFCLAKDLIKTGMSEAEVLDKLKKINFRPPLDDNYLAKKVIAANRHLQRRKDAKEKKVDNANTKNRTTPNHCHVDGHVQRP